MTRSLKARALQWLAQREHSRAELRRKLLPHAVAEALAADGTGAAGAALALPGARVDALLDWLEAHKYLSQERFVESRVHVRAQRYGNLRIRQELKQHDAALSPDAAQALAESELRRACAVRARKFGDEPPASAVERARQSRFLAGRGFTTDVIWRALRGEQAPSGSADDAAPLGAG